MTIAPRARSSAIHGDGVDDPAARMRLGLPAVLGPVGLLALAIVLAGCGSSTPIRADRFYGLNPTPLAAPAGAPVSGTVLVNDLAAPGLVGGRQILFRTREDPLITQRYDDLLWEEAPSAALANALAEALRAARVFQFVVRPSDHARAEVLLGGEIRRFEHLPTESPPAVAAALHLTLVRASDRQTLADRTYTGTEPLAASTPDAMVEAFARLSARLVAEAVRDLQAVGGRLTTAAPAPPGGVKVL